VTGETGPASQAAGDPTLPTVLVAGSGTVGWMTAAVLCATMGRAGDVCRITVVGADPDEGVSVGEATRPAFAEFAAFLGLAEHRWMPACNAVFSFGARFEGWSSGSHDDRFWQVFGSVPLDGSGRVSPMQLWVRDRLAGEQTPSFARAMSPAAAVAAAGKAPKNPVGGDSAPLPSGFHVDTVLLTALLREYATSRGVAFRSKPIDQVEAAGGRIGGVRLEGGEQLTADLYVDCTGMRGSLIGKSLGEPWLDWSDHLPCDRAVVVDPVYAEGDPFDEMNDGIAPFTTIRAIEAGWTWRTPLLGRLGAGYAYASAHLEPERAERRLRELLGPRAAGIPAHHLTIPAGRRQRSWVGNCVAIGAAAASVEPLTSTRLTLVQEDLFQLAQNLPDSSMADPLRNRFNRRTADCADRARDVLVLPYVLSGRVDTSFWRALKDEKAMPESLNLRLREWRDVWPTEPARPAIFGPFEVCSILAGMGWLPQRPLPAALCAPHRDAFRRRIEETSRRLISQLPVHAEYFRKLERINVFRADDSW